MQIARPQRGGGEDQVRLDAEGHQGDDAPKRVCHHTGRQEEVADQWSGERQRSRGGERQAARPRRTGVPCRQPGDGDEVHGERGVLFQRHRVGQESSGVYALGRLDLGSPVRFPGNRNRLPGASPRLQRRGARGGRVDRPEQAERRVEGKVLGHDIENLQAVGGGVGGQGVPGGGRQLHAPGDEPVPRLVGFVAALPGARGGGHHLELARPAPQTQAVQDQGHRRQERQPCEGVGEVEPEAAHTSFSS
ncbi:MAG: hypothetical protein ACRDZ8_14880 [Acidimicrobiales bacterium]